MSNAFQQIISMQPPFNMIVLIMILVFGTSLITSLGKQCRKYACHRQELDFKREMLDRGLSVDEIERVVRANTEDPRSS